MSPEASTPYHDETGTTLAQIARRDHNSISSVARRLITDGLSSTIYRAEARRIVPDSAVSRHNTPLIGTARNHPR